MMTELVRMIEETVASCDDVTLYDAFFNEHSRTLRVFIDARAGVDVELCARVSALLSRRLDQSDVIAGKYRLEVSSPGIERPLRRGEHFEKARGQMIKVVTSDEVLIGTLFEVDDSGVRIKTEGGTSYLAYSRIKKARVIEPALVKGGRA